MISREDMLSPRVTRKVEDENHGDPCMKYMVLTRGTEAELWNFWPMRKFDYIFHDGMEDGQGKIRLPAHYIALHTPSLI